MDFHPSRKEIIFISKTTLCILALLTSGTCSPSETHTKPIEPDPSVQLLIHRLQNKGYRTDSTGYVVQLTKGNRPELGDLSLICKTWTPKKLAFIGIAFPPGYFSDISACSNIERLDFSDVKLTPKELFLELPKLKRLSSIFLYRSQISDIDLQAIPYLPQLSELQLAGNRAISIASLRKLLECCKNLELIDLTSTKMDPSALNILLEFENLNSIGITDAGIPDPKIIEFGKAYQAKYKRPILLPGVGIGTMPGNQI